MHHHIAHMCMYVDTLLSYTHMSIFFNCVDLYSHAHVCACTHVAIYMHVGVYMLGSVYIHGHMNMHVMRQ